MIVPINRLINPPQLDSELIATFPSLKTTGAAEFPVIHYTLTPTGANTWRLEVPDNIDSVALATLIATHNPATTTPTQQLEAVNRADWQNIKTEAVAALTRLDAIQTAPLSTAANLAALNRLETAVKDMAHYESLIIRALGILAREVGP